MDDRPRSQLLEELLEPGMSSLAKLFLIRQLLQLRREFADLFAHGDYIPLAVSGEHAAHLMAFARVRHTHCVVAIVSRWTYTLAEGEKRAPIGECWKDARVELDVRCPAPARIVDVFTQREMPLSAAGSGHAICVADALASLPVAVLQFA